MSIPVRALPGVIAAALVLLPGAVQAAPVCTGNCDATGTQLLVATTTAGSGSFAAADDMLTFADGAFVGAVSGVTGTVTLSGAATSLQAGGGGGNLVEVGSRGGVGKFTLDAQARMVVNGFDAGASGAFRDPRLFVGSSGTGRFEVLGGAQLEVADPAGTGIDDGILIGHARLDSALPAAGELIVQGSGSRVDVSGNGAIILLGVTDNDFSGASAAQGLLEVSDGGRVAIDGTSRFGIITVGRGDHGVGELLVTGAGSRIDIRGDESAVLSVSDDFLGTVGNGGIGQVHVTDGGVISVSSASGSAFTFVGLGLGSASVLVDDGGLLDVDGAVGVSVNNSGTGTASQRGLLVVNDSGRVETPLVVVGNGTSAGVNGILAGTGSVVGDVRVQTGGVLAPGQSPGRFRVAGGVTLAGGTLEIEIAGLGPGEFDVLDVNGAVDLDGALVRFVFLDGFLPRAGDELDFVLASSLSGLADARFDYAGAAAGFTFDVMQRGGVLGFAALSDARAVPGSVPATLFALGMVAVFELRRRNAGTNAAQPLWRSPASITARQVLLPG